jgi:hypothetical protein
MNRWTELRLAIENHDWRWTKLRLAIFLLHSKIGSSVYRSFAIHVFDLIRKSVYRSIDLSQIMVFTLIHKKV